MKELVESTCARTHTRHVHLRSFGDKQNLHLTRPSPSDRTFTVRLQIVSLACRLIKINSNEAKHLAERRAFRTARRSPLLPLFRSGDEQHLERNHGNQPPLTVKMSAVESSATKCRVAQLRERESRQRVCARLRLVFAFPAFADCILFTLCKFLPTFSR